MIERYARIFLCCIALGAIEFCHAFSPRFMLSTQKQPACAPQRGRSLGKHLLPTFSFPRVFHLMLQDSSTSDDSKSKKQDEELTLPKIAELVDVSFVQACLQLAEGYVDVLKLMIAAVQSAYVQGISPSELIREINAIVSPSAGRPLMPEEEQLRNQWIQIVYIMLTALKYKVSDSNRQFEIDSAVLDTFGNVAPVLIRRRQLSTDWHGQEMWDATSALFSPNPDGMQKALTLQSLRVMWVTLSVVEDVERCEGEFAKMDAPLAPPIPGAFESEFLP